MPNGRDDNTPIGLQRVSRSVLAHLHLAVISVFAGIVLVGCSATNKEPFTSRTHEDGRAERIKSLRSQIEQRKQDRGIWAELGVELLRESESRLQDVNETYSAYEGAVRWPLVEPVLDESVNAFRNAIKHAPSDARFHMLLGRASLTKYRYDPLQDDTLRVLQAISSLEQALRLDPDNQEATVYLALALMPGPSFRGDLDKAISCITTALSRDPEDGMAYFVRSGIEEVRGQYHEALASLRDALRYGLKSEIAYLELPLRYQRNWRWINDDRDTVATRGFLEKTYRSVMHTLLQVATPLPPFFETGVHRSAAEMGLRNPLFYDGLSRTYATFNQQERGFGYVIREYELDSLSSHAYWYTWQYRDSSWIERFLQRIPPGSYYGRVYAARMYLSYQFGDSIKARALLKDAIEAQPEYGEAYVVFGRSFVGQPSKSIEWYTKALSLQFHQGEIMLTLAEELAALGEIELGLRCYNRMLTLDLIPRMLVLRSMGISLEVGKQQRRSLALYRDIDRQYPSARLDTWWGRGIAQQISRAYIDSEAYDDAIRVLQKSLSGWKGRKQFLYDVEDEYRTRVQIGDLYAKKGDSEHAKAHYQQAIQTIPDYPDAYRGLGEISLRDGQKELAIDSFKKAAARGMDSARESLKKLGITDSVEVVP